MSYQRLYPQRINWEDEPSLATPINQVNLNKMDSALFGIDARVVELDENKAGKNDTFNTSRNGVVPKPTQADITNEKVLRADGVWVEQSGGGGGGGGHTIVDNAGTSLQQRGKLKTVGGLNATDDSENNTTKITDEYEIIPWTTWQGYSDAEKAEHPNAIVTDAPDCDGDIEIENWKDLWTNNNYSSAFTSSNVTLNSDDYDFLYFDCLFANTNYIRTLSIIIPKGQNGQILVPTSTGNGVGVFWRNITRVSDTEYVISDCSLKDMSTSTTTNNSLLIPYKIYGFKKKLTAKIKAIAHDVSTDASKCMLSNGGNVEDALSYSATEQKVGKWFDEDRYRKTISFGALPNATTKSIAHGISNLKKITKIEGVAIRADGNTMALPTVSTVNLSYGVNLYVNATSVNIETAYNYSTFTETYVTLEYTKTS